MALDMRFLDTRASSLFLVAVAVVTMVSFACGDDDRDAASATSASTPTEGASEPEDCPSVAQAPAPNDKQYDAPPEMTIDDALTYTATIQTVRGDITVELRPDLAPETVNSFVFLARDGFYDGVEFHRVDTGFLIQAGDPNGSAGGPGFNTPAEYSSESFVRGSLGITRSNAPEDRGSKWFITTADAPNLDGQFTLFGRVSDGLDVVDCIQRGDQIVTVAIDEG